MDDREKLQYAQWFSGVYQAEYDKMNTRLRLKIWRMNQANVENDIEDCLQEAFEVLWTKREELIHYDNIGGWLYLTCFNKYRDKEKKLKRRINVEDMSIYANVCHDEKMLFSRIDELAVDMPDEIELLKTYYGKEKSRAEMAKGAQISAEGLKKRIYRITQKVRERATLL